MQRQKNDVNQRIRIFHGVSGVSLQSTRDLVDSLRKFGYTADSFVYRSSSLLLELEDYNLNINMSQLWKYPIYICRIIKFFLQCYKNYDVFHFHYGRSFFPFNLDLRLLKKLGKKVFMEYHGSEIRYKDFFTSKINLKLLKKSNKLQKRINKNVDAIIVHDRELKENLLHISNVTVHDIPLRIDVSRYSVENKLLGNKLKFVHAPSRRTTKGTEEIIQIINDLQRDYEFDFQLIEAMPYPELQKCLATSDVLIDQILIGSYGMLAIEAMCYGKTVICNLNKCDNPDLIPIISADSSNLKTEIIKILQKKININELGQCARNYVQNTHSSDNCAKMLLNIYEMRSV